MSMVTHASSSLSFSLFRHKFTVSIETGERIYQPIDMSSGKPVPAGWATGKVVQRAHHIREETESIYVVVEQIK